MFKDYLSQFIPDLPQERFDEVFSQLEKRYGGREDPWGLSLDKSRKTLGYLWPLYKNYFKVRVFGAEKIGQKPYLVTSNHSGQIAIDGLLTAIAFAFETEHPRILRPMVERFFTSIPWVNMISSQSGAVLGDRHNCRSLLKRGESILVYPEGVSGVAKNTSEYYQLQHFTRGFFRISLESGVEVLPIAVVGAEEMFPYVYQAKTMAKMLGLPALPLAPMYLPLPSPVDIYIGEPYPMPDLSPDAPDHLLEVHVSNIRAQIKDMIDKGLEVRRPFKWNQS
jgi:1-acyl-sn-glycerol-3-phosphate acyltransferase